jgi:hypothetical protein
MKNEQDIYKPEPLKASSFFELENRSDRVWSDNVWLDYWQETYFEKNEALKNLLISLGVTEKTAHEYEVTIDQRGELLAVFHIRKIEVWRLGRD